MGKVMVMGRDWEQVWVGYDGFSEGRRVFQRFWVGLVLLFSIDGSGLPS